jgi:phage/plasmid-like protein (TIGR03299 family)
MAHEIDTTTGQAAVFVTGQPAWHRLGAVVSTAQTSAAALKLARLDWQVNQLPLRAYDPDARRHYPVPGRVANVRSDTGGVLGIVSTDYRVFQNAEAFDFMDSLVGDKLAMFETAGALFGGRTVWMLARIPQEHRVEQDVVQPYVLVTNTHDGSRALRIYATSVRVVCNNTLTLSLRQAGSDGLTIYHLGKLEDRVRAARNALGIVAARFDQFDAELHRLIGRALTPGEVHDYFDGLLPRRESALAAKFRDKTLTQWNENYYTGPAQQLDGTKRTAWAAYNAVSEWADHQARVRGATQAERDNQRLHSAWFGRGHQVKQRAFGAALALAN